MPTGRSLVPGESGRVKGGRGSGGKHGNGLPELLGAFLRLGCISFGGPTAHLGYLHEEFVTRRRWLDDVVFADLVALCQFLPGPSSSQLVFALGMHRAGLAGALLASVCFTLPSAVLMILFGYGVSLMGDLARSGWLHGLKLAAIAVVAQAVLTMRQKLCPDLRRLALALGAAAALLAAPTVGAQIGVIGLGAVAGWIFYRRDPRPTPAVKPVDRSHFWASGVLICWGALLVLLPLLVAFTGSRSLAVCDSFYRVGSLVVGGGHVVLPLLRAEVVPPGWVSDDAFLAGYGAAQALPGPLFTFAAYLGTVMSGGALAWLSGLLCLGAILLPAWMLIGGALPFWNLLRGRPWAHAALQGANAAVVGVLMAALVQSVRLAGATALGEWVALGAAFGLLGFRRVPPWAVVLLMAAVGQWIL